MVAGLRPDEDLDGLHTLIRGVTRAVLGDDACRYPPVIPHLTTAYAHGEADSDQAQRILRRVRPGHADLTVDAVHWVDARANPTGKAITWDHLDSARHRALTPPGHGGVHDDVLHPSGRASERGPTRILPGAIATAPGHGPRPSVGARRGPEADVRDGATA
ncbi:hypothetical protein ACIRU3_25860 [Streptomyces sp. NPDC101151]|uniref:hypothetical protein n=1 Tax=Streptomyces sp. NPDC101151 TaxID=3366115 RepID=UPI0037FB74B5